VKVTGTTDHPYGLYNSNTDVPEHIVQSQWNLKMYTATVFEKKARQPMLEKYFKDK
jgi:hypothetical protein